MDRHTRPVESDQDRLCLDALDGEASEEASSSVRIWVADATHALDSDRCCLDGCDLSSGLDGLGEECPLDDLGGYAESNDADEVLEPATTAALLRSTLEQGREWTTLPNQQSRRPDGASDHLSSHGHGICIKGPEIDGDVPEASCCIDVNGGSGRSSDLDHLSDIGQHSGFVVGYRATDEVRWFFEERSKSVDVDVAVSVHGDLDHSAMPPSCVEHARSLGRCSQDASSLDESGHRSGDRLGDG